MSARRILWYVIVFLAFTNWALAGIHLLRHTSPVVQILIATSCTIFAAFTNWALAGIHLLRHTSPVVQILIATSCTIFAVLNRRNRKA